MSNTTTSTTEKESDGIVDLPYATTAPLVPYKDLLRKQEFISKFLCLAVLLCSSISFLCLIAKSSSAKWLMGSITTIFTLSMLAFWMVTGRLLNYYHRTRYSILIDGGDDVITGSNTEFHEIDLEEEESSSSSQEEEEMIE